MAVSPEPLAGHDVLQAVAIDINQVERVKLGKGDAVRVRFRLAIEDEMLLERDLAALLDLFVPGKSITVSIQARDDVIETVSIDIIHQHLRRPGRKGNRMFCPNRITF